MRDLTWKIEDENLVPYVDGVPVPPEIIDEVLRLHGIREVGNRVRGSGRKICTLCRLVYAESCEICGITYVRCVLCGQKLRERRTKRKAEKFIDADLAD